MFIRVITVAFLLLSLSACQDTNLEKAQWIIGTWANQTSNGIVYETWSPINDQELRAKSYTLQEKDTILFETIQLIQQVDDLFYIPTVAKQNEGKPIPFTLKTITNTSWVFENLAHDFPQRIAYQQINTDSLVATISGIQKGRERAIKFPMSRLR